ncbi:MAG: S8 family serine peptidase, partial [Pseudomonadota bacterium]|nr:S8 family serine peptidase [Pseudomonadota bacterium]
MQTIRVFERLGIEHVKIPEGINLHDFINTLKNEDDVEYAEPNYIRMPLEVTPNDPEWLEQWGLVKTSMPDVWNVTRGSDGVIAAVIDTGVDFNHPDIAENIWKNIGELNNNGYDDDGNGKIDDVYGWDFYNNNNYPMDFRGHGTHVAGIIGAVGNNAKGITGVNWNVRIMPLKFMEETGNVASEIKAID